MQWNVGYLPLGIKDALEAATSFSSGADLKNKPTTRELNNAKDAVESVVYDFFFKRQY